MLTRPRAGTHNQNSRGPFAALYADEIWQLRSRYRDGWKPAALAEAYGVSTRTIYRYLRWSEPIIVRAGKWQAGFVIRDDGPNQIGPWEKVA